MTSPDPSEETPPLVSFAVPVRNGERFLPQLLDSLAAQDHPSFEVVVSDNASSDRTGEIARSYAHRDPRFRYFCNERDLGQIANFNSACRRSTGKYFRWVGADDWLAPTYARRCVEALEARPDCVGCTTLWHHRDDQGAGSVARPAGKRLDSSYTLDRMSRMLWFLQAGVGVDPIYSMLRRDALTRTALLPVSVWTDRSLALELSMLGPFCHVDEVLAVRRNAREPADVRLSRYHPQLRPIGATSARLAPRWTMYRDLAKVVWSSELDPLERVLGVQLVAGYAGIHHARAVTERARGMLRAVKSV